MVIEAWENGDFTIKKNMKNDGQIWTTGDLTNDVHGESTKKKHCGLRWFNNGH